MSSAKNVEAVGVLAVVETTYGTDPTPSASTDGVQIIKPRPELTIGYLYDGKRGLQNGGYANIAMCPKRGRHVSFTIRCEAKGNGSDYTSSAVVVPHIHALLKCAGYTAAYTSVPDLWTFTPTAATATPSSCTVWLYTRAEVFKITGVYANLKIICDTVGIPVFEFACVGIMATDPADASLAAITYHSATVIPPAATAVTFVWGDITTPILRSMTFDMGRVVDNPRASQVGTDGHAGFTPGARNPSVEMLIESSALATGDFMTPTTFDFYNMVQEATLGMAFSYTCGATQYNKWVLAATTMQPDTVELVDEGPAAMLKVVGRPYTTQTSAADHTITFS